MTFTKTEVSRFITKLYRFLENGHRLEFKKLREYSGHVYFNLNPTHVIIDHRKELIPTLIHETLHYFYPDKSEKWIIRMEKQIVNKLSERQVRNIIRHLAQNI
jgi:hypothetical protein